MNVFSIKDLEQLSGIKAHTIRIWEQRYTLLKPKRTDTNIRFYSNEELKAVLNISLLNRYGYKISHIDKMTPDEMQDKIVSLSHSDAQQERLVNELIQCMIDLDIEKFEEVLDKCIAVRGIEKAITNIVFTFLEKVGILWQTNHVNPAQEHCYPTKTYFRYRKHIQPNTNRQNNFTFFTRRRTPRTLFTSGALYTQE